MVNSEETQEIKTPAEKTTSFVAEDESIFVDKKYKIFPYLPLASFDYPHAKAFAAEDISSPGHKIFALICDPEIPVRKDHIRLRTKRKMEGLLFLVDSAVVYWEAYKRRTMVLFYDMPLGGRVRLSEKKDRILPEDMPTKTSRWIRPLAMGINSLAQTGLTHRAIRPDNLFYLDIERTKIVLGDCISTPPAYDQDACYETVESSMCVPEGRGNGTLFNDLYSLAVTLLFLELGFDSTTKYSEEELLFSKIHKGSYATLVGENRVSLSLIELLRGLLIDNEEQRWDVSSILFWTEGRRLTPVQAKYQKVSQRPFVFNNKEYFSYRLLADAFVKNWSMAAETIRSEKFLTWLVRGFEDKSLAQQIEKSMDSALVRFSAKDKQEDYYISRTCMLLDPQAPLRTENLAFMPNSLGTLLFFAMPNENKVKKLIGLISTGFVENYCDLHKDKSMLVELKNIQRMLQKVEKGEGIERVLYDLNEGIPCQSPLVVRHYVEDVRDLLPALEDATNRIPEGGELIDAHIAAFLAANVPKKMQEEFVMLNSKREFVSVQGSLSILVALQKLYATERLFGLCRWVGSICSPIIESYFDLDRRKFLEKNLPRQVKKGDLIALNSFLNDPHERRQDISRFEIAKKEYAKLSEEIEFLDGDREKRDLEALTLGNQVAAIVSFSIAVLTMFILLVIQFLRG